MQAEPAEEAEAVQHLRVLRQVGDALVVHLLVEIQASLVAAEDIHLEAQAVQVDRHRAVECARQQAIRVRQPFEFARGHLVALDDGAWGEKRLQRSEDYGLPLVHAKGRGLHHQHIFVFVHHQAAEGIAFGVDDPE